MLNYTPASPDHHRQRLRQYGPLNPLNCVTCYFWPPELKPLNSAAGFKTITFPWGCQKQT